VPSGLVTRVLAGFFDVTDGDQMIRCKARGVLRKRGLTILVGDQVVYQVTGTKDDAKEGIVDDVLPRVSELVRPPVANVSKALLVFSITNPEFSRYLLDKALVVVAAAGLSCTIVLTKCDLVSTSEIDTLCGPYQAAGIEIIPVSTRTHWGTEAVRRAITGHVTVFVGPSGAGKSSLANELSPALGLRMGEVSEKVGRGKHTTRHTELFRLDEDTYVADTAGFSQLLVEVDSADLRRYFPEFVNYGGDCSYRSCMHQDESGCAIKQGVDNGNLSAARYASYLTLYEEIRNREANRY